jgi:hypothetical protein
MSILSTVCMPVVPAEAGTHTAESLDRATASHHAQLHAPVVMGPGLRRGDD